MKSKTTATDIKYALMYYFRFTRQWICASECLNNDVMAITDKDNIEVEIKINKYDLWNGEAKKKKHTRMLELANAYWKGFQTYMPNRFYICVPERLKEEAKKWVEMTNKKYGIVIYYPNRGCGCNISILKIGRIIKKEVCKELEKAIMMRVCSENIGLVGNLLMRKRNEK